MRLLTLLVPYSIITFITIIMHS